MAIRRTFALLHRLAGHDGGAMVIETAIIAPVLVLLSLGGYEVSRVVSRQHELQSGVAEAEAIALVANVNATTDTDGLKAVLMDSLSLKSDQVTVAKLYRCGTNADLVASPESCPEGAVISSYVRLTLHDRYEPIWRNIGIRKTLEFNVVRTVQLS
jgi:hypothetical protein